MKRFLLLAAVLLASVTFTHAQFTFVSIDYPGGFGTRARGINNHGQIVGSYFDQYGNLHALLIEKGKFIPLAPGTILDTYSDAFKINDRGDVVGWVCPDTCHAFLYNKGVVTTLDFPGASDTYGWDINESGTVAGVWDLFDSQGNFLYEGGFLWKDGNFTEVTYPGAGDTGVTAINARGDFAGVWDTGLTATTTSSFVFSKGVFTNFDAPFPDVYLTQPDGMNSQGKIVGQFYDTITYLPQAFLKVGEPFTLIEYPGAVWTTAWGINSVGQMVGNWLDGSGVTHGWLAQPGKKGKPPYAPANRTRSIPSKLDSPVHGKRVSPSIY
jgi:uncharacterized membrane protein